MNRIYLLAMAGLTFAVFSCTKKLEADTPSLDINIDPSRLVNDTFTYKLGDTTKFIFSGAAGNLAFYPGDAGRNYDNRNRDLLQLGIPTLSFSSTVANGTQSNTLQLLATNKLAAYDSATVVAANWTDITSRVALAINATVVPSGPVNLTNLISGAEDSLFLVFKYTGVTGSVQPTWTITNFIVNNVLPDKTHTIASLGTDLNYWTRYGNVWSPANARWTATATQLQIVGGAASNPSNTSWIISKPLYLGRVSPDLSIAVKNINDPLPVVYNFKYVAAGTYKATWVIFNNTAKGQQTVVKEFFIKVNP